MSVVEDFRKVLQDFLAPELRTISARLDSIEKVMEARFDSVSSQIQEVKNLMEIEKRLTKLETKQPVSQ